MHRLPKIGLVFSLFFLFLIPLLSPSFVSAAKLYTNYNNEDYDKELEKCNDAAKQGKTEYNRTCVDKFGVGSAIHTAINLVTCTSKNQEICKPEQTALGNLSLAMSTIYANPPATLAFYTKDFLANAGFVKPAHAQGIGFAAMSAFLNLWKVSRNIAYSVLIIVMVAIGFMIIFRMKIDPKTVISIQAALPKIILTLVIITFSYPIVGLLIDIMYLSMAISISLIVSGMGGSVGGADVAKLQSTYMTASMIDLFGAVFWPVQAFGITFFKEIGAAMSSSGLVYVLGSFFALPFFGQIGLGTGVLATIIPAGILLLIVVLGLLFSFIRLFLLLLNSWIQVIIALILGPIQLLMEAVPGKSAFTEWILNILANLVVFPATALIIIFSTFLTIQGQSSSQVLNPPFIGILSGSSNILGFLGLGVMFMAPTLVASVKKMFAPKPALPISSGTLMSPLTGSFQTAMGAMSQFYYASSMLSMFKKGGGDQHHS